MVQVKKVASSQVSTASFGFGGIFIMTYGRNMDHAVTLLNFIQKQVSILPWKKIYPV
jgi:hypothetical protein